MKVGVVGAGIAGLAAGRRMLEGGHEVKVFEKAAKPGGLVRCDWVNNHLYHRIGGHVFNSKHTEVLDWFWKFFDKDKEFVKARRNAKIYFEGRFVGYPIENYLYQLPGPVVKDIVENILELQKKGYKAPHDYHNFRDFLEGNFGKTLFDLYFQPYNEKIWQCNLEDVSMEWLDGKLPMPRYEEMLTRSILREEENEMVHSSFFYPKINGSQFIVERLAEGMDIATNCLVENISWSDGKWTINHDTFDQIVYTGDVRLLKTVLQQGTNQIKEATHKVANLKVHGTSNVLCETDDTDLSWLYLPESKFKAHRIIYTGNFSDQNNAEKRRKSCVVEFTGQVKKEVMLEEIRHLPGNLAPIDFNYEPFTYVIQERNTRELINNLKTRLMPYGFELLGRFAEWEYYNMDAVIKEVLIRFKIES